jgi:hypothetical protein
MHISGNNFVGRPMARAESYSFSRINHCWGWATWKRAWDLFDEGLTTLESFVADERVRDVFPDRYIQAYTMDRLKAVAAGKDDSWAYVWNYSCYVQNGLTCRPAVNLVRNIGFSEGVTHTTNPRDPLAQMGAKSMSFPLRHPRFVIADGEADRAYYRRHRFYQVTRFVLPLLRRTRLYGPLRDVYWRVFRW